MAQELCGQGAQQALAQGRWLDEERACSALPWGQRLWKAPGLTSGAPQIH